MADANPPVVAVDSAKPVVVVDPKNLPPVKHKRNTSTHTKPGGRYIIGAGIDNDGKPVGTAVNAHGDPHPEKFDPAKDGPVAPPEPPEPAEVLVP